MFLLPIIGGEKKKPFKSLQISGTIEGKVNLICKMLKPINEKKKTAKIFPCINYLNVYIYRVPVPEKQRMFLNGEMITKIKDLVVS